MHRFTLLILDNANSLVGVCFSRLFSTTCIVFLILIFDIQYMYYEFCILY